MKVCTLYQRHYLFLFTSMYTSSKKGRGNCFFPFLFLPLQKYQLSLFSRGGSALVVGGLLLLLLCFLSGFLYSFRKSPSWFLWRGAYSRPLFFFSFSFSAWERMPLQSILSQILVSPFTGTDDGREIAHFFFFCFFSLELLLLSLKISSFWNLFHLQTCFG